MGASTPLCLNWWGAFSVDRTDHHRFVLTGQRIFLLDTKEFVKVTPSQALGFASDGSVLGDKRFLIAINRYRGISWPQIEACESVTYSWSDSKVMLSSKLLLGGKICKM